MSNFPEVACWVANELARLGLPTDKLGLPDFASIKIDEDTPKALAELATLIHHHPVLCARVFFDDSPKGYVRATRDIGVYAASLGSAIECRLKGDLAQAEIHQASAERVYATLPKFARW
jgi:hypothetical protein